MVKGMKFEYADTTDITIEIDDTAVIIEQGKDVISLDLDVIKEFIADLQKFVEESKQRRPE